ncbi:MAG: hypothetical protein NVSMB4_07380 [Acidimicrobiales bacterium]
MHTKHKPFHGEPPVGTLRRHKITGAVYRRTEDGTWRTVGTLAETWDGMEAITDPIDD